ncbi:DNA-formamidopyrimidine glycosylase [Zhaonella formicivorans]|uniref:DNA-formamidopyrimidine glycosylase n=1 Tax=Zhaonella formicivorans TaxID=2528593 RepID=UPI0010D44DDD|nr:DNA-formamidopyrimidine glycosylase [Zhaonella formicivorans]
MPELPEVETVRRSLEKRLVGRTIRQVNIYMPKIIKIPEPKLFARFLEGQTIVDLQRRGKYLLFCLASGYVWVTHLRMTGQFIYSKQEEPLLKHTHLTFTLDNGHQLRYVDIRQFGTMYLLRPDEFKKVRGLRELGPEPLGEEFTLEELYKKLAGKKGKVKQLLLNQAFVAGIGNIYADEILFDAGLHPERGADTLSPEEIEQLYYSIRKMLELGIANRGTTVRNYVDGDGRSGNFQELLKVYGRAGEPCYRCGRPLIKQQVAGRSSCYCPNCQK